MLTTLQQLRHRPLLLMVLLLTTLQVSMAARCNSTARQPNIVYILLDDAGWNDFESHDPRMATPNIRKLREDGIFLSESYTMPMCVPARAALLTGRYPHTMGMQDITISGNKLFWLNETLTLLPQVMKTLGYRTHMLGKWHMGFCHPGLLPQGRGFDTFYGMLMGAHHSYYNHTKGNHYDCTLPVSQETGRVKPFTVQGKYQTDILSDRAVRIIKDSNWFEPFFMFLSYGAPHGPFEVPDHYVNKFCPNITNSTRQIHCGMMAALDVGVGRVVQELKNRGLYSNTVILLMSDNGGPVKGGSVNWPLRGGKKNLFEGGTRSYTVLRAPGLPKTNITWPSKIHIIDWLPTIVEIGGGTAPNYTHGISQWTQILRNEAGLRTEFIYTVNDFHKFNHMAIRKNEWKLIGARPGLDADTKWSAGFKTGWYRYLENGTADWDEVKVKYNRDDFLLFNIVQDPYERNDLSMVNTTIVQELKALLESLVGNSTNSPNATYPLYPIPTNVGTGKHAKNGFLKTCWCKPPSFDPCE